MFNLVVLTGRLTADPELKTTSNGLSVTTFSIAVDRRYRSGEERQTDFINIVAWRTSAEFICKYFKKGSMICVIGNIQTRSWDGTDGKKQYATDVMIEEVYFAGEKKEQESSVDSSWGDFEAAAGGTSEDELPF